MSYTIKAELLRTLIPFISKEQSRFYLNGVYFDNGLLVATNGHILAAIKPSEALGEIESFILPMATIKAILAVKPSGKRFSAYVTFGNGTATVTQRKSLTDESDTVALSTINYTPIDGIYPVWRRVLPKLEAPEKSQVSHSGFSTKYLAALESLGDNVLMFMNPDAGSPSIFKASHSDCEAFAVIMPMRSDIKPDATLPEWIERTTTQAAA